ncbi:MAG: hypothetical protein AAF611_01910 [Bacteroidota bacterium]
MKTNLLYILILNFLFCAICQSQESFEGVITFKVDVIFKKENAPYKEYIIEKFGDTMQMFYNKKGDIHRRYKGTGPRGYDFHTYRTNTNNYYAKWKNLDTLYFNNVKENILKFIDKEVGTSTPILNKPSKYILIRGYVPKTNEMVNQKFYYTGYPYLDPKLYKNYKEFFTDEILQATKSPFLKFELELDDCFIIYTAISVEKRSVNPKIFKIPKNIPHKKS